MNIRSKFLVTLSDPGVTTTAWASALFLHEDGSYKVVKNIFAHPIAHFATLNFSGPVYFVGGTGNKSVFGRIEADPIATADGKVTFEVSPLWAGSDVCKTVVRFPVHYPELFVREFQVASKGGTNFTGSYNSVRDGGDVAVTIPDDAWVESTDCSGTWVDYRVRREKETLLNNIDRLRAAIARGDVDGVDVFMQRCAHDIYRNIADVEGRDVETWSIDIPGGGSEVLSVGVENAATERMETSLYGSAAAAAPPRP